MGAGALRGRHDARDLRVRPQPPFGDRADGPRPAAGASRRRRRQRAGHARRGGDRRHVLHRAPGRAHRARRRGRRRGVERRRGAHHRRVGPSRQAGGQHRVRRHPQRTGRADGARDEGRAELDAGARRRAGGGGAGLTGTVGALRRPLRAHLHAAGLRRRARSHRRSGRARRRSAHLAVPGAGAAHRRLPVLAGHLHPGGRRLGRRPRRPRRRAHQGRPGARGPRPDPDGGHRQDRHADRRPAAAQRRHRARRTIRRPGPRARRRGRAPLRAPARPGARRPPPAIAAWTSPSPRASRRCPAVE